MSDHLQCDPRAVLNQRLAEVDRRLEDARGALLFARPDAARHSADQSLRRARSSLNQFKAAWECQGLVEASSATADEELVDMQRRKLLEAIAVSIPAAATAITPNWENPADTDRLTDLDERDTTGLEEALIACSDAYYGADPTVLAPMAGRLVDIASERLQGPRRSARPERMNTLLAEAALMTGWLSITLNRRGAARAYLCMARDAADEVQNSTLQAYALASLSTLSSLTPQGGGGSTVALRLLERAHALLPDGAANLGRAWLSARLAEEQAGAGDVTGYRRNMARAEDSWTPGAPGEDGCFFRSSAFFSGWNDRRLDAYRGTCLLLIGRPHQAEAFLSDALAGSGLSTRSTATILTDLAAAQADQQKPDEATHTAMAALDAAERSGYLMARLRLHGVRRRLEPWRDRHEVVELDERLQHSQPRPSLLT